MPKRKRRRRAEAVIRICLGLEARGRVGWAKYYDTDKQLKQAELAVDVLRERVDVLVAELIRLIGAVLNERNIDAFAQAYQAQTVIDEFTRSKSA